MLLCACQSGQEYDCMSYMIIRNKRTLTNINIRRCKMTIEKILNEMVAERVAPGGVLLVSRNGKTVLYESFGMTRYQDEGLRAVTKDTIYDIASITKIFTATAALILADQGEISLDDKLAEFFPRCAYGDKVAVRHLLTHTSGISSWMARLAEQKNTSRKKTTNQPTISQKQAGRQGGIRQCQCVSFGKNN